MSFSHCSYCEREMNKEVGSAAFRTKDHVVPQVIGGKFIVWACLTCNNQKGAMTPAEWLSVLVRNGDTRSEVVARFINDHADQIDFEMDERVGLLRPFKRSSKLTAIASPIAMGLFKRPLPDLTCKQLRKIKEIADEICLNLLSAR